MLILYYKPTCPYCQKTIAVIEELELKPDMRDISADDKIAEELIERGGKRQVPYLIDEEKNVEMYESDDIIEYLKNHYGPDSKLHREADPECEACQ